MQSCVSTMDRNSSRGQWTRRSFVAGSVATVGGLAGCSGSDANQSGGDAGGDGTDSGEPSTATVTGSASGDETLTVSVWSGTYADTFREAVKPRYEEATGNTLEVVGNWSGLLSKIRSAPADDPPYDISIGGPRVHYRGAQDDLWQPVRYDNFSNDSAVKPRLMEYEQSEAAVPVNYGLEVYVYDESRVDSVPETWAGITDLGNVALSGFNFSHPLMMAAIMVEDEPLIEEVYDESYHDRLFSILEDVDVSKFYSGSQDMWTAMSQGIADVGQYYYAYSLEKDRSTDNLDIGVYAPETTVGYVDYYQVVRGADRELAEGFLDFLLGEAVQTAFAQEFNVGMANENTSYPELSREQLPTTNESLQEVAFMQPERIAEFDSRLEERYAQLQDDA
jgi:spermidine/putrescine transport system substrate-binding protein